MPKPKKYESQSKFVNRCVKVVIGEGNTRQQALGKCYGIYQGSKK